VQAEDAFVAYQATEDVVYGHKDGMALTLDVIEPLMDRNGIGLILVSSGSWISKKSDNFEEQDFASVAAHSRRCGQNRSSSTIKNHEGQVRRVGTHGKACCATRRRS
jgi:hypothetical protein